MRIKYFENNFIILKFLSAAKMALNLFMHEKSTSMMEKDLFRSVKVSFANFNLILSFKLHPSKCVSQCICQS